MMASRIIFLLLGIALAESLNNSTDKSVIEVKEKNLNGIFDGVYSECFLYLSYDCLQKKTLLYLEELNKLSEVSVIGDYVKFVKTNPTENDLEEEETPKSKSREDLSCLIDKAVDKFFNNHVLKFNAFGRDVSVPSSVNEFVGRKRKGGGGGGGGHHGDDGGKKKMMMMAMMCMKMKFMMMVPAMMGMMGMMSFKGMMFSMMSFMIAKMMLLMKILEKKGGGGGGGGGGDGGWAAGGGGGGGAWMPAGGDYGGGGGGGGGYDANGQWQSRSILERNPETIEYNIEDFDERTKNKPTISYVAPVVSFNNKNKPYAKAQDLNYNVEPTHEKKARIKRDAFINSFGQNMETINDSEEKSSEFDDNMDDLYANMDQSTGKVTMAPYNTVKFKDNGVPNTDKDILVYESSVSLEDDPDSYEIDTQEKESVKRYDIPSYILKNSPVETGNIKLNPEKPTKSNNIIKSRSKRGIYDLLQSAYIYWMNRFLGTNPYKKLNPKFPKYKIINGVKYVYYPVRQMPKPKAPRELQPVIQDVVKESGFQPIVTEDYKPIVAADDFNKGEIVEGAVESRMTKKMQEFHNTVSEVIEDNPWQ